MAVARFYGHHVPPAVDPIHSHDRPQLRPPQFTLRTLLLLMAVCGVLLALDQWLPHIAVAALALLLASIFCHVAGNAIGTRLREIGDQRLDDPQAFARRIRPLPHEFAPATQLGQRRSLGWLIVIATLLGVVLGGWGGGLGTFVLSTGPIGPLNVAVGVIAFAMLGGMAAFATVAFLQVLLSAIWQAMKSPAAASSESSRTITQK